MTDEDRCERTGTDPGTPRRPTIRPVTEQDWPAVFAIFAAVVAAGQTYAYPEALSSDEARALWTQEPGRTVVAVDGSTVLGSARAGPNRPGRGAHVATASFMVDAAHGRRGVGRALGEDAIAWARAAGYRSMQFNAVVETNVAAVRLWQSLGFRIIGTVPEAFDHAQHGFVGLHVMHRSLLPPDG